MLQSFFLDDDDVLTGSWFDYDGSANLALQYIDTEIYQTPSFPINNGLQTLCDANYTTGNPIAVFSYGDRLGTINLSSGIPVLGDDIVLDKVDPTPPPSSSSDPDDFRIFGASIVREGSEFVCVYTSHQRTGDLPSNANQRALIWLFKFSTPGGTINQLEAENVLAEIRPTNYVGATPTNTAVAGYCRLISLGLGNYVLALDSLSNQYPQKYVIVDNLFNSVLRDFNLTGTDPQTFTGVAPPSSINASVQEIHPFSNGRVMIKGRGADAGWAFNSNYYIAIGESTVGGVHGKYLNRVGGILDLTVDAGMTVSEASNAGLTTLNEDGDVMIASEDRIVIANFNGSGWTVLQNWSLSGSRSGFLGYAGAGGFGQQTFIKVREDEWVLNAWTNSGDAAYRSWSLVVKFSGNTIIAVSEKFGSEYIPMRSNDLVAGLSYFYVPLSQTDPEQILNIQNYGVGLLDVGARILNRI